MCITPPARALLAALPAVAAARALHQITSLHQRMAFLAALAAIALALPAAVHEALVFLTFPLGRPP